MFRAIEHDGPNPTVELADIDAASSARLAPWRGGLVTSFQAGGRERLYLDPATLANRAGSVRGGVPVLFPSPGKLAGDAWAWGGQRGALKQHGFARDLPWEVAGTSTAGGASVTLRLRSSEGTRAQYPWDFLAEFTYTLRGASLRIELRFTGEGPGTMPFGAGFHPYFAVAQADKARARIPSRATRAFDNRRKVEVPFTGFDLTGDEVDLHLIDHESSEASLEIEGDPGSRLSLRGSPEFGRWVIWTLAGRDFVCVEPWTCPGDALNTGEQLLVLAPGESRSLWLEISAG